MNQTHKERKPKNEEEEEEEEEEINTNRKNESQFLSKIMIKRLNKSGTEK